MKCEKCGKKHDGSYGSGRFCSAQCARGFSTKEKREEINKKVSLKLGGNGLLKGKITKCLCCGKDLTRIQINRNIKYCSIICNKKVREKNTWERCEKKGWNKGPARTYLINKNGHKCELCNETKWQGQPIPLVLDHIDGNSDNYKLNNIRMICRNCDGLLPTFSGRNVGKGRHTKRMASKKARREKGMSW